MNRFVVRGILSKSGLVYTIADKKALEDLAIQLR